MVMSIAPTGSASHEMGIATGLKSVKLPEMAAIRSAFSKQSFPARIQSDSALSTKYRASSGRIPEPRHYHVG